MLKKLILLPLLSVTLVAAPSGGVVNPTISGPGAVGTASFSSGTISNLSLVSVIAAPTNTFLLTNNFTMANGSPIITCDWGVFTKNHGDGTTNFIAPGDDLSFPGNGQIKIVGVLSAKSALFILEGVGLNNITTTTNNATFYPCSIYGLDINSRGAGGLGNAFEYMGEGSYNGQAAGVNSGQASSIWMLNGSNTFVLFMNNPSQFQIASFAGGNGTWLPGVIVIDTQNGNNHDVWHTTANGNGYFSYGITNLGATYGYNGGQVIVSNGTFSLNAFTNGMPNNSIKSGISNGADGLHWIVMLVTNGVTSMLQHNP